MSFGITLGALLLVAVAGGWIVQWGFTNVGLTHVLATEYTSGTAVTTWYLGLINNSPAPTLSSTDTIAAHAGWAESTAYTGTRPAWGNGAVSSNATTNASTVNFAMNATVTIYGLFVCSHTSSNLTSNCVLECTAAFSGGTQAVNNGDTLQCTMTISAASG